MLANEALLEETPADVVVEMSATMDVHAANGEWERVEEIASRLKRAVMAVPEDQRRESLVVACRSLENARTLATGAKRDVTDKLSAIRRGKVAARAYTDTD